MAKEKREDADRNEKVGRKIRHIGSCRRISRSVLDKVSFRPLQHGG